MTIEEMRSLDAEKTYKELEEAKNAIDDLKLRVKHDFQTILKFKAENQRLINKIEQLYEGAEEQRQRIKMLVEAGDALKAAGYFGGWGDAVNKWVKVKEEKA